MLILFELLLIVAITFATTLSWSEGSLAAIPFIVLVGFTAIRTFRSIATRIKTLNYVSNGRLSITKMLSTFEALLSLEGLTPQAALQRCFDAMDTENGYDSRSLADGLVRGIMTKTFVRKHPVCSISITDGVLLMRFEFEEGGAIWADGGRFEREARRIWHRLHEGQKDERTLSAG
ncbi:hypothetical protein AB0N24_27275 [Arthrobacter sp. NPDC093128]|uniref:hypothetical protein n=1 Tax=Arthrobacter sp. NPDC093128 TaxID=3154979 RepID=UPI0034354D5E